jgi:hypothetical protein
MIHHTIKQRKEYGPQSFFMCASSALPSGGICMLAVTYPKRAGQNRELGWLAAVRNVLDWGVTVYHGTLRRDTGRWLPLGCSKLPCYGLLQLAPLINPLPSVAPTPPSLKALKGFVQGASTDPKIGFTGNRTHHVRNVVIEPSRAINAPKDVTTLAWSLDLDPYPSGTAVPPCNKPTTTLIHALAIRSQDLA